MAYQNNAQVDLHADDREKSPGAPDAQISHPMPQIWASAQTIFLSTMSQGTGYLPIIRMWPIFVSFLYPAEESNRFCREILYDLSWVPYVFGMPTRPIQPQYCTSIVPQQ